MEKILMKSPLFKGIKEKEISESFEKIEYNIKNYSPKECVVFRGDTCDRLIIILKGKLYGEMMDANGKNIKVDEMHELTLIAPAFIFGNNNNFPVDVVVSEETQLLEIPVKSLLKMFKLHNKFLENYLNLLCNKTQFLTQKIWFGFSNKTIKKKVADFLLNSANEKNIVVLKKTMLELSEVFGVERPSLSRVFSDFSKKGIIEKIDRKTIKILDSKKLEEI